MQTARNILILTGMGIVFVLFLNSQQKSLIPSTPSLAENSSADTPLASTAPNCVPTFQDGGGPYYQANAPFREVLAPENHGGEELIVTGRVLQNDCVTPMANVVVDIWQANETGNYEAVWYRGQIRTDDQGEYTFTTVVPKGYGEGTGYRPPHIHFKIWQNDRLLITSQMFLPESRRQGIEEAFIMEVESEEVNGVKVHRGYHDIVVP